MTTRRVATTFLALLLIETSAAFLPVQSTVAYSRQIHNKHFSSPVDEDKDALDAPEREAPIEVNVENENPLSKLNSLLDTPILDANNKKDEGPIAEALKDFVRDDSDMASLTFSVVVVLFFGLIARGAMYLINGY